MARETSNTGTMEKLARTIKLSAGASMIALVLTALNFPFSFRRVAYFFHLVG